MPELDVQETLPVDFQKIFEELEEKSKTLCTELEERLIIITATLKLLKQDVSKEKDLWKDEIKKTIELECFLTEHNNSSGDFNHIKLQNMFSEALLKGRAQLQNEINTTVYKQQLLEAENMCNLEMIKIKNSLECLAPLQAIVDEWNNEINNDPE